MKKIVYVVMMTTMFMATSCGKKALTSGIKLENLDTTIVAGDDFYRYACGGWMQSHPLTAEYARYGSFDELAENNREQLRGLITELAAKENAAGSVAQKIGDLYNLVMDSVRRNAEGYEPIKPLLAQVEALQSSDEVLPLMAELNKKGVPAYFHLYIDADPMSSSENLLQTYQGGLSLGEREYYLDNDEATVAIRNAFKQHIVKMLQLAGNDEVAATKKMESVMAIETKIAEASFSATEQRNPIANYHKMTVAELKEQFARIDWEKLFAIYGLNGIENLSVSQIEPIKAVEEIVASTPVADQKAYIEWKIVDAFAGTLSDAFESQNFEFYGKVLSGKQEQKPRWKRAVGTVNGTLSEAVGQMYVQKYFPAAAKQRMEKLVANLQTALGQRIDAQTWMSDSTKALAHEKLDAFYVKVGYPNKWQDYSQLNIDKNKSYAENMMAASEWAWQNELDKKLGKPVDRDEWYMSPQTVNAYYNPTTNEICFPAGILQYPFFDMNADDAFNYGAIGVVIGHEMTHGFDDQGRQFDKNGNLTDWWTAQDAELFKQKTQVLVNHFNKIEVLPGLFANGELTLGENIADHGGLMVSYQAFKNATAENPLPVIDGFTPEQRFFLAYAAVWAGNIREEQMRLQTKSDPHSLGRWRVNGTLPHIDAWYDAFGIDETSPMYLAPEQRADIW